MIYYLIFILIVFLASFGYFRVKKFIDDYYYSKEKAAAETAKLNSQVAELVDYQRAANSINVASLNYQRDTSRNIKNLPVPN